MSAETDCIFCRIVAGEIPSFKLFEDEHTFAFMDINPANEGHALVVPRQHVASIYQLSAEEQNALWTLVANVRNRLSDDLAPQGFNIGLNDGESAGQTILHAHIHIIPRRDGDVNDPRGGVRWIIPEKARYW